MNKEGIVIRFCNRIFALAVVFLGVSACTNLEGTKRTAIYLGDDRIDQKEFEDEDVANVVLDIIGNSSDSDDNLDEFIRGLDREELGRELQSFLVSLEGEDIDYSGALPQDALKRRLSNIGGFYAILGMRAFVECVVIRGNRLKPGDQRLFGKIVDYAYNENTSGAHIDFEANHALTCAGEEILDEKYSIHISVTPYNDRGEQIGLIKHKKNEKGKFPVLRGFLPNDPEVLHNLKDMNYKLHTIGESINITAAFRDGELLPQDHPIYLQNSSSCIDIFFMNEPDPFALPPQHEYCMGRCAEPPLINTGH